MVMATSLHKFERQGLQKLEPHWSGAAQRYRLGTAFSLTPLLLLLLLDHALHFLQRCFARRETAEPIAIIAFPGLSIKLPSYAVSASSDYLPWPGLRGLSVRRPRCQEQRSRYE